MNMRLFSLKMLHNSANKLCNSHNSLRVFFRTISESAMQGVKPVPEPNACASIYFQIPISVKIEMHSSFHSDQRNRNLES